MTEAKYGKLKRLLTYPSSSVRWPRTYTADHLLSTHQWWELAGTACGSNSHGALPA